MDMLISCADLGHRRPGTQLPIAEFVHVVGNPRGGFGMSDENDRLGFRPGHVLNQRHHFPGGLRVKIARRLVRQQKTRTMDKRSSQSHALLFPSG